MQCFVVFLVLACGRLAAGAATSCTRADHLLARYNVSADESREPVSEEEMSSYTEQKIEQQIRPPTICHKQIVSPSLAEENTLVSVQPICPECHGHCCGRGQESQLRTALRRTAESITAKSTRRTSDLLLSTRRTLQQHLTGLSHQSQNKTAGFFTQLYQGQAIRTHGPLASLYEDIRMMLRTSSDRDLHAIAIESNPPRDLVESARKFFRDIFPMAYLNFAKLDSKQFTPEYEACLKDAYDAVRPFGDVPTQLGSSLGRSLEAARVLLEMLAVGAGALATTEHVLSTASEGCSNKLLKAAGCAVCGGHDVRPCRNYCLNIARGCIGSLLSQLDGPWAGYVEGVERLTRVDADLALRQLEGKVQEAIMYSFENRLLLENKVRHECGPPSTIDAPDFSHSSGSVRRADLRAPPPDTELLQFAATLASTKKLFSGLADRICYEPDFADEGNDRCWNGEKIGEYTKPLVTSISMSDQRYNPEVSGAPALDARITTISDRLQQARTLLISHLGSNEAQAEAFMQGDEAGEEGSGSGRNYPDDDAAYDAEGSGEEGSGSSEVGRGLTRGKAFNEETIYSSTPKTSGASAMRPLLALFATLVVLNCFT